MYIIYFSSKNLLEILLSMVLINLDKSVVYLNYSYQFYLKSME